MSGVKLNIKKVLRGIAWSVVGMATIALLIAAVIHKDENKCAGINVKIEGADDNFFIDKSEVSRIMTSGFGGGIVVGKKLTDFDLRKQEKRLEKEVWISKADLFFDNNNILQVQVQERTPIARIFTTAGHSFYIDKNMKMLPLSDKLSAKVPVFTGFVPNVGSLARKDSALLKAVKEISISLAADDFLMAMVDQIDITEAGVFNLIPKIGNQLIVVGTAEDLKNKFDKLKLFYKQIMLKAGWGRYSSIDLQYENQIVAKLRDAADVTADSLRTLELMELMATTAATQAEAPQRILIPEKDRNPIDSALLRGGVERDTEPDEGVEQPPVPPPAVQKRVVPKENVAGKPVKPAASAEVRGAGNAATAAEVRASRNSAATAAEVRVSRNSANDKPAAGEKRTPKITMPKKQNQ